MTEHEWLSSTDPAAMLRFHYHPLVITGNRRRDKEIHDRQLRWWVEGCRVMVGIAPTNSHDDRANWPEIASRIAQSSGQALAEKQAHLLRCVVGNPYRPVECRDGKPIRVVNRAPDNSILAFGYLSWLTPAVQSLARACHEGRECGRCGGTGKGHTMYEEKSHLLWDGPKQGKWTRFPCSDCHGTGHTGIMDKDALKVLWDRLETEGCENEEIRRALMLEERCPLTGFGCVNGKALVGSQDKRGNYWESEWVNCVPCNGTGWIPARYEPVRGFWAVELLREEE